MPIIEVDFYPPEQVIDFLVGSSLISLDPQVNKLVVQEIIEYETMLSGIYIIQSFFSLIKKTMQTLEFLKELKNTLNMCKEQQEKVQEMNKKIQELSKEQDEFKQSITQKIQNAQNISTSSDFDYCEKYINQCNSILELIKLDEVKEKEIQELSDQRNDIFRECQDNAQKVRQS